MSTKASDWYLYADTDLHDPENAVQFFKYWQAIRAEQIEHYINHKEFIPQFVLVERLVEEFPSYSREELDHAFFTGYEIVYADQIANEHEIDEELQNSPEVRELSESLFKFIKFRLEQDFNEKEILKALEEDL
jgi:hypothetical protein